MYSVMDKLIPKKGEWLAFKTFCEIPLNIEKWKKITQYSLKRLLEEYDDDDEQ